MEELELFIIQYGWQLGLIALAGIIILGVLKYANVFSKIKKENRKPIYFLISIGFSLTASIIYLICIKQFEINFILTIAIAIYTLNQTMYAIYETTKLKDLVVKILDFIKLKLSTNTKTIT